MDPGVVQRRSTHAMAVVCLAWIKITVITVHTWSQRTINYSAGVPGEGTQAASQPARCSMTYIVVVLTVAVRDLGR